MNETSSRYRRERLTVLRVLEIHCGDHGHPGAKDGGLCAACEALRDYADARLRSGAVTRSSSTT